MAPMIHYLLLLVLLFITSTTSYPFEDHGSPDVRAEYYSDRMKQFRATGLAQIANVILDRGNVVPTLNSTAFITDEAFLPFSSKSAELIASSIEARVQRHPHGPAVDVDSTQTAEDDNEAAEEEMLSYFENRVKKRECGIPPLNATTWDHYNVTGLIIDELDNMKSAQAQNNTDIYIDPRDLGTVSVCTLAFLGQHPIC